MTSTRCERLLSCSFLGYDLSRSAASDDDRNAGDILLICFVCFTILVLLLLLPLAGAMAEGYINLTDRKHQITFI